MVSILIAIAAVLAALGLAFVVWVWRTDKALRKALEKSHHDHFYATLGTKENQD